MNVFSYALIAICLCLAAGFVFLAFYDIPVHQENIVREIPFSEIK